MLRQSFLTNRSLHNNSMAAIVLWYIVAVIVTITESFDCAPYRRQVAHHKTVISLFPRLEQRFFSFFTRQWKVVVDCSSFSSVGSLFHARAATTEKAQSPIHWGRQMTQHAVQTKRYISTPLFPFTISISNRKAYELLTSDDGINSCRIMKILTIESRKIAKWNVSGKIIKHILGESKLTLILTWLSGRKRMTKYEPPRRDMNICGKTLLGASWCRTHRRNWRATLRQFPGTTTPLLITSHIFTIKYSQTSLSG